MRFSPEIVEKLSLYSWPGNVRELEGLITYLSVIVNGTEPTLHDLPNKFNKENYEDVDVERIVKLLEHAGDVKVFKEILQCLSLNRSQYSGIGRTTLKSMMTISISENQLRTRLEVLKSCGLIHAGVKKQGTKITCLGISMLEHL